jgi:hypothetical protein
MHKIFIVYVASRPKFYSYIAQHAHNLAKNFSKRGESATVVTQSAHWIDNHQHVVLIQSSDTEADAAKLNWQKQQVTKQKIFSVIGESVPASVHIWPAGKTVEIGHPWHVARVTFRQRDPMPRIIFQNDYLIHAVVRKYRIDNSRGQNIIRELGIWLASEWDSLNLTESPW